MVEIYLVELNSEERSGLELAVWGPVTLWQRAGDCLQLRMASGTIPSQRPRCRGRINS